MPLDEEARNLVHTYCVRDLPGNMQWHIDQFLFVQNIELQKRLGRAYYSARYVGKLMEALAAADDRLHPFVKFQIMQYASIYEAVISYLLWGPYKDNPLVQKMQTHKAYKPVAAMAAPTTIKYGDEDVFTCVNREAKTPKSSISFGDKVDCAVAIGFLDRAYADDIKKIYKLRNLAHIETEAETEIEVEISHAKAGYWRIKPFLERITMTLNSRQK